MIDQKPLRVHLKKVKSPDSYSGSRAAYEVFVDDIKIGKLASYNSRIAGVSQRLIDNNGNILGSLVGLRGERRKILDSIAIKEYNSIIS